jgi:hypothetical protein
MKKLLLSITLLSSLNAISNTISDANCDIYLPVNSEISSWGGWQQNLIDKGYNPIEIKNADVVPNGALVGSLGYNLRSNSRFLKNSHCNVEVEIKRMNDKENMLFSTLFSMSKKQKRVTVFNTKIKCTKAERKIRKKIPNCKVQ